MKKLFIILFLFPSLLYGQKLIYNGKYVSSGGHIVRNPISHCTYSLTAPSTLTLSNTSDTSIIHITSNSNWTASSNQTWLKVSGRTHSGNDTVILNYSSNSGSQRSATVTATTTGACTPASANATVTQAAVSSGYTVYSYNWNNIGTYQDGSWTNSGGTYDPDISDGLSGHSSQSSPAFPYGPGWSSNAAIYTNSATTTTPEYISGYKSLDQILQPFIPNPAAGSDNSSSNYRAEICLEPCDNPGIGAFTVPSEIWLGWAYYWPDIQSAIDQALPNDEEVWHQFMPDQGNTNSCSPSSPQHCLMIDPLWGNILVFSSWNSAVGIYGYNYRMPGTGCNNSGSFNNCITCARSANIGHIVPGIWMKFVEKIIWDNTTNGSLGGSYELWVTLRNKANTADSVTNLWYDIRNFQTACSGDDGTTPKFGPYIDQWHVTDGGTAGNASISAGTTKMEVFISPIKMEFNKGTTTTQTIGPSGYTISAPCIDNNGYNNVSQ
jgi:hypothetical protein